LAQRLVFITGDTVSPHVRALLERTGCRWISKPFNIQAVEDLVAQLIREARSTEAQLAQLYAVPPKRAKLFHAATPE